MDGLVSTQFGMALDREGTMNVELVDMLLWNRGEYLIYFWLKQTIKRVCHSSGGAGAKGHYLCHAFSISTLRQRTQEIGIPF